MKNLHRMAGSLIVAVVLAAQPAAAQSSNPQAVKWFNAGVAEKEAQKKIDAYIKAIALDPQFVEAFYNLGMAYKQQQDFANAEKYLAQASRAKSAEAKSDLKVRILYELATTYRKLDRPDRAEETLRQAGALSADNKALGMIALELGRLLYQQNRYEEAAAELQNSVRLAPENASKVRSLAEDIGAKIELQRLYEQAEKAKDGGNLAQAQTLFERVKTGDPNFKNVQAQLEELNARQKTEATKDAFARLYDQARKLESEGNLDLAVATYENLIGQAGLYKDARTRAADLRQKQERGLRQKLLEEKYAAGMAALRAQEWTRAILAFEKILEQDREFGDARKRLAEAQAGLNRESAETIVARYYADGVAAMSKNDLGGALAAFEKVRKTNSNYRNTAALMAEVETALQKSSGPPAQPATMIAAAPAKVDSLYQLGVAAAGHQDWVQAVVNFEKVQLLQSNYRDAVDRLAQARVNLTLAANSSPVAQSGRRGNLPLYLGGAALLALPLLGFIALSPAMRARLHLLRGNYAGAAQIYEKSLARRPDKVKLYAALANLYLLLKRRDESALKVYKMVLQLNLATNRRDEMSAIVAQNYLTEGRTDSDAIEVLESALKAEQRRQQGF